MTDDFTITVGQTKEIKSTSSKLVASSNNCIETTWNSNKSNGDYYIDATGVEEGSCYLIIKEKNNDKVYDTITIYVMSSGEGIATGDETSDDIEPPVVVKPTLDVPGISASTLTIDSVSPNTYAAEEATILSYGGSITYDKQKDIYYFDAPYDGRYRMDIGGLQSGTAVELYIFDASGKSIISDTYCKNNEGITVKDIKAGETYEVQVRHISGYSDYELSIALQKKLLTFLD